MNPTAQDDLRYTKYLRKSSEQEDRQVLSIESQKDELQPVIKAEKLNVVKSIEESHSAKKRGQRLGFNQMVEDIEKGRSNAILLWNISRLSRNAGDTGVVIDLLDSGHLKEVRTPTQVFRNTPNDKFLLNLFCSQAKLENDTKGEDVKKGLAKKARLGWLPSGAPTGYKNTPDKLKGFKVIEEDPERFPIVRRIWDLMLTGNHTVSQIYEIAKEIGLTTAPRGRIGGKPISKSGMYAMFTNPFYYGYFEFPKRSGNWLEGSHKPVVSKEEFDQVQSLIHRKDLPRPKKLHLPYNGLMHCSNCDGLMSGEVKVKKQKNGNVHNYVFYSCKRHKDKLCKERSIEVKSLLTQTEDLLEKLTVSENLKNWAIKHVHEIRKNETDSQEALLQKTHRELEAVVQQLDSLMLKYTSPENVDGHLISPEELKNLKGSLIGKKSSLETKLSSQGREMESWVELTEKTFNFACYAKIWFQRGDENNKRIILSSLASNLIIKDRKIAVELHPYFKVIVENKDAAEKELAYIRTSKKGPTERQKGTFVPSHSSLLRLLNSIRTSIQEDRESKFYYFGLKRFLEQHA